MNTQPEALRLAEALERHDGHFNINAQMDAATLLRTQHARIVDLEMERDALKADAERYRWLASSCRSTSEHWGGRWSIVIDGPAPTRHDCGDAFDAAIDAARLTRPSCDGGAGAGGCAEV